MAEKPTQHTPGPWNVCDGDGMHVYYVNPRVEAGEDIDDPRHDSIVAKCDDMGCMSGIPDEERQANARLIAAAPELLAACEEWDAWVKTHANELAYGGWCDEVPPLPVDQGRAAIARATGKSVPA